MYCTFHFFEFRSELLPVLFSLANIIRSLCSFIFSYQDRNGYSLNEAKRRKSISGVMPAPIQVKIKYC